MENQGHFTSSFTRRGLLKAGTAALVLGSSSTLLAACTPQAKSGGSSSGGSKKGTVLSLWNFYGPSPKSNPQSDWYVNTVKEWNKTHDVQIKLKYVGNADYVQGSTLQTAFASGDGPDIFIISPGSFLQYYNGGVLKDLTPYVKDVIDDFLPGMLTTRTVDGKIYAIPTEAEPLAMYYSKKAFSDAGITSTPKTWDDLLGVAKTLTTKKRFGLLFEPAPGVYQNFTWYPYMWQGHGNPTNSSNKATFDSAPIRAALGLWKETVATKVAPRKALGTGSNDIVSNLAGGYVAMQECGSWAVEAMATQAKDFDYGVFPLPTPPGGTPASIVGGWAFCANAKGKDPEAAAEFIAWAVGSSSKSCVARCRQWDLVKSDPAVRKSVQDLAQSKGDYDNAELKYFVEKIVPTAKGEPRFPPQVVKAISDAVQSAQLTETSVGQAAKAAQNTIAQYMATYNGASLT